MDSYIQLSGVFEHSVFCVQKYTHWKMWCFTLQSMGRTNHKFPIHVTQNVQTCAPEINCKPLIVYMCIFESGHP